MDEDGYTDIGNFVTVTPIEYGFTAEKGHRNCSGTIKRLPFSISIVDACSLPREPWR